MTPIVRSLLVAPILAAFLLVGVILSTGPAGAVTIEKILEKRQGAPIAQTLYQETQASIEKREANAIARKNNSFFAPHPDRKPDKKQRRELLKMKSS